MNKKIFSAYLTVCMVAMMTVTSYAYLDPSTATYVFQAVVGLFIAGGATCAVYWHKIKRFFKKGIKKNSKNDAA